jgi:hypothetical protein
MVKQTLQMSRLFEPVVDHYDDQGQGDYAMGLKTYRYLRLSMIIVMVALAASVLLAHREHTFFEQSISAYYYTSAHSVFVGVLVAIGVALTVIKGRTAAEDWLLGIAGVFAPIIAFVPTTSLHAKVLSADAVTNARDNVGALLIAGWTAWIAVCMITLFSRNDRAASQKAPAWEKWLSVVGMAVLLAAGTIFFFGWWTSFVSHAHDLSAGAMFGALGAAALVNGIGHPHVPGSRSTYAPYYVIVGVLMLAIGVAFVVTLLGHMQYSHELFEVESLEILLFVAFWGVQSWERWNWTVAPPPSSGPGRNAPIDSDAEDDYIDLHWMDAPTHETLSDAGRHLANKRGKTPA